MDERSDLQLMAMHITTLFACDAAGRLLYVREPGNPAVAPRFYMGRTLQGNIWHLRHDLPAAVARDLEQVCQAEPAAVDPRRPPHTAAAIRAILQAHAALTAERRGPAYRIPDQVQAPMAFTLVTSTNAHLLQAGFPWVPEWIAMDMDVGPFTAVIVDGSAVAICFCARLSAAAAEAGVVTLEGLRGRGYASAAVAGWAAAVRERGLVPLYSTSWENLASQGVARRLGMLQYGEDWWIE